MNRVAFRATIAPMKSMRISRIVLTACAVFAAVVLFVTYGTVLPAVPFASIQLDGPTTVDSDGKFSAIVDSGSRRVLILNGDGDLTGVVDCTTADTPVDAVTGVCVVDEAICISGVRFAPDSDVIQRERVAFYDKGGNFQGVFFEKEGAGSVLPAIKSLSDAPDGVVIAYAGQENATVFELVNENGTTELKDTGKNSYQMHDAAFSAGDENHYATLDVYGTLYDDTSKSASSTYAGHAFTSIDIGDDGTLYACDDTTGALCARPVGSDDMNELVKGDGYDGVHENNGLISLCESDINSVTICDDSGTVKSSFSAVTPSIGFSARMVLVWACGLYLAVLLLVLAVRKVIRLVREGKTESFGPMILAVAVVSALAVAVGSLSLSSYQSALDVRAREINMCADYLTSDAPEIGKTIERAANRDAMRIDDETLADSMVEFLEASGPAVALVDAASKNDIGMYCTVYGKDDKGIYYLFGTSGEYVVGTSARASGVDGLDAAFEVDYPKAGQLLRGRALRDTVQYRLVQIPSADQKSIAGVIEIGSKTRSFEASLTGDLASRILALLVMVLVVYLAYSELRACGRCLFSYRQRRQEGADGAAALLTRPFTLAITMLSSIDSVMTVLIARDMLSRAGIDDSSPLLALPAVMLGAGLIVGQMLYGAVGRNVGLRRLMSVGALVMLLCACLTGAAVTFGTFWMYCAAKLVMSIPFGMLYTLGYSLPRLARDDDMRAEAAGGVKRTDTSAAALGTVLGGYAAQGLGNGWVYVLVAVACIPVIIMALNLLPRGMQPLEALAQPDKKAGRIRDFVKSPMALGIALLVVLPATVAAGYASFLFPLFSVDLGLSKSQINNIFVLGQLVVYVCIGRIEHAEGRFGRWRVSAVAVALLGVVFLLFSVNATLVWSIAVVALVGLLCKAADSWKGLWQQAAGDAGVPAGRAVGAMFATRSLALIAQPFILGALLGAADAVAVLVIGVLCVVCAGLFFLVARRKAQ